MYISFVNEEMLNLPDPDYITKMMHLIDSLLHRDSKILKEIKKLEKNISQ